jgi:hypothetical protein
MGDTKKKLTDQNMSEIDQAIQKAKDRKATKSGMAGAPATATTKAPKAEKPEAPKKARVTDEEKAQRLVARDAERAERKTARDAARAEKLAARTANRSPAHMKKVQKAAERLAPLSDAASLIFNEATTNLTAADLTNLALHVQHFNRVKATERALGQKIEAGQTVTVIGGDSRYIGKTGIVAKAQRIRCYVDIAGFSKPAYLFTSDVSVDASAPASATA